MSICQKQLYHEHHKVPVTALEFFSDQLLLSGEGTELVAYSVSGRVQLGAVRVFPSQAIHAIVIHQSTQKILVYGGCHIAFIAIEELPDGHISLVVLGHENVGDWIFDAAFSPQLDDETKLSVALITAHNALMTCTPNLSSQTAAEVDPLTTTIVPGSNCILYCAHISWLGTSQCLVASGTAFGDIILWSLYLDITEGIQATTKTHYIFQAHEGSVFGVQISPPASDDTPGRPTRMLASCSDDRTVRLWDISNLEHECPSLTDIQRETGFGSIDQSNVHAPPLLANAMGHISRIWEVRFVSSIRCQRFPSAVVSFGEDGSRITWDLTLATDDANRTAYKLLRIHAHPLHAGKNIWSAAVSSAYCATGGADGCIALSPAIERGPGSFDINDNLVALDPEETGILSKDSFKSYAFVSDDKLVATASEGRIVVLTRIKETEWASESFGSFANLHSFSVVIGSPGVAFVAGDRGTIFMYSMRINRCFSIAQTPRKVAGLFVSDSLRTGKAFQPCRHSLLVTTVGSNVAQLFDIEEMDGIDDSVPYTATNLALNLSPGFVVKSFSLFSHGNAEIAVIGSRNGSMAFYHLPERKYSQAVDPVQALQRVHSKESVTAVRWHAGDDAGQSPEWLFSTGRDGTCAIYRIGHRDDTLALDLVHQLELPFGPNIEGLTVTKDFHLLVWGFSGRQFIAHDVTIQQDVLTVECGGRVNLTWAYKPSTSGGTFAWAQNSRLVKTTQTELPHQSIHPGGHGREIKALTISGGEYDIIATGSEDTDIKLFAYSPDKGFKCLQTLRKHNTGIQHLQWSADGCYLFSSAGSEEFYIWRVCHDVALLNVGVVCESAHPRTRSSDLRITSFALSERTAGDHDRVVFDITMAYSDSTTKTWSYNQGVWALQASGDYLTACLTGVVQLSPQNKSSNGPGLLTTATDGFVTSWEPEREGQLTWLQRRKIHQNAILDVATKTLTDGSTLIVTAGDDNGIGFSRFRAGNDIDTLLIPRAHASAVTALTIRDRGKDCFSVFSASIDQRLKLWNVRVDVMADGAESFDIEKAQNVFTSVADVSSMSLLQLEDSSTGVLICGVGMDMWRLPHASTLNGH